MSAIPYMNEILSDPMGSENRTLASYNMTAGNKIRFPPVNLRKEDRDGVR